MNDNSEAGPHEQGPEVEPLVKREHLNKTWVGLGLALDWIAWRGQSASLELDQEPKDEGDKLKLYRDRENMADEALVSTLADLPPEIAESLVRGEPERDSRKLVPIPSGVWRQTATSDANDAGQPYRLIGTDDDDSWEGAILGVHVAGYRRIQIRSAFILEKWPEHTLDLEPVPLGPAASPAAVRRVIETAIALTDDEMAPISQREMLTLVKRCFPNARRTQVRDICTELMPTPKPGPKGERDPNRQRHIEELGQKLITAQLHN